MAYTFLQLAEDVLRKANRPLTVEEIWEEGQRLDLAPKVGSSGKTPWRTIGAQIYMENKTAKEYSRFQQISKRPAKFCIAGTECSEEASSQQGHSHTPSQNTGKAEKVSIKEKDLHILVSTFLRSNTHFKCYAKTISEKKSAKRTKGHNEWLHPNMVGVYFPFEEYQENTLRLLETFKENPYKLFSFEIKVMVNFANLREYYFQAVSNSSWADEGYLVAMDIQDDSDLIDELRRLNNAFGIGVIVLNAGNIEQSEILFAAKPHEKLDWDTIDRLVEENSDFRDWLQQLMDDVKVGKVRGKYDSTLSEENRLEYFKKCNIPYRPAGTLK